MLCVGHDDHYLEHIDDREAHDHHRRRRGDDIDHRRIIYDEHLDNPSDHLIHYDPVVHHDHRRGEHLVNDRSVGNDPDKYGRRWRPQSAPVHGGPADSDARVRRPELHRSGDRARPPSGPPRVIHTGSWPRAIGAWLVAYAFAQTMCWLVERWWLRRKARIVFDRVLKQTIAERYRDE